MVNKAKSKDLVYVRTMNEAGGLKMLDVKSFL